jgi:hypothetical protein
MIWLQTVMSYYPGDMKAEIGQEREYYTITGKHSLDETYNENRKLLIINCSREECGGQIKPPYFSIDNAHPTLFRHSF